MSQQTIMLGHGILTWPNTESPWSTNGQFVQVRRLCLATGPRRWTDVASHLVRFNRDWGGLTGTLTTKVTEVLTDYKDGTAPAVGEVLTIGHGRLFVCGFDYLPDEPPVIVDLQRGELDQQALRRLEAQRVELRLEATR